MIIEDSQLESFKEYLNLFNDDDDKNYIDLKLISAFNEFIKL